ncbi:MAG: HPF/RaiA family ribosome-associated protein [bacterium]
MRVEIRDRGIEPTESIRDHAERRLRFALGRFDDRIRVVRVSIGDLNGPHHGGVDKSCRLEVCIEASRDVHIETRHEDLYAAISDAADRAGRAVARSIRRDARPASMRATSR